MPFCQQSGKKHRQIHNENSSHIDVNILRHRFTSTEGTVEDGYAFATQAEAEEQMKIYGYLLKGYAVASAAGRRFLGIFVVQAMEIWPNADVERLGQWLIVAKYHADDETTTPWGDIRRVMRGRFRSRTRRRHRRD